MQGLMDIAIMAYRVGRYRDAIGLLRQVTDSDSQNWLAYLYLAKAYEEAGSHVDAQHWFAHVAAECPDIDAKQRAENGLKTSRAQNDRQQVKQWSNLRSCIS